MPPRDDTDLRDDSPRSDAMPPRAMDLGLDGAAMRRRIAGRLFGGPIEPARVDHETGMDVTPGEPEALHASTRASDAPRRRRNNLRAAALTTAIVAAVAVGGALTHRPPRALCPDPQAQLGHAWDDAQRQAVRAAFAASDLTYAAATHDRIERDLDAYAARWIEARRDTCEAQWQRGRRASPPQHHDDSARCLDSARTALSTRVRMLAAADHALVADADAIVAGLPTPEHCRDSHALVMQQQHERTTDPTIASDLERARVHLQLRQGHQAVAVLTDVLARLHTAKDTIGEAEALLLLGKTQARVLHEPASATRSLDQAHDRATTAGRHELTWDICSEQARIRAAELDESEARRLLGHARSALQSLRTADPRPAAAIQSVEATLLALAGRLDEAVALRRTLVDALRRELVATHPDVLAAHDALADSLSLAGAVLEARTERRDLLTLLQQHRGADHPLAARVEVDLARDLVALADLPSARNHLEHARGVFTRAHGPTATPVADADVALAELDAREARLDRAIPRLEAALAVYSAALPRDHADRVHALTLLMNARATQADDHAQLLAASRELITVADATPRDIVDLPAALTHTAESLCHLGRCAEALPYYERLLRLHEQHPPTDAPELAVPLRGIGLAHLAAGRPALALPFLERAQDILQRAPQDRPAVAESLRRAARDLARALEAAGQSPARVRSLRRLADAPVSPVPAPPV